MSNHTVVVVEDDPLTQDLISGYLKAISFKTIAVPNGESAVSVIRSKQPAFVIIDLMLSRDNTLKNGWDVLVEMRQHPELNKIPALTITAYWTTELAQKALTQGFADVLPKPITPNQFYPAIRALIQSAHRY